MREVHLPVITEAEAAAVWRVFGMDERGHCPLPGHDGGAVLRANDDKEGELELRCDCLGAELKWGDVPFSEHDYSLADVYFSMRSGTVLDRYYRVPRGYRLIWRMLLLAEVGVVMPEAVELAPLPDVADDALREARALFGRVCGVRLALAGCLMIDPLPTTFTVKLVRDWCRLSQGTAHMKINELQVAGVISAQVRPARGPVLYVPAHFARSTSNDLGMAPLSSQPSVQR